MQELQIDRVYRHFKGDYYLVEGLAHDSESGVPCVIYRKLYGDGGLWVRPLEMFLSRVDREKNPEVRQNTASSCRRSPVWRTTGSEAVPWSVKRSTGCCARPAGAKPAPRSGRIPYRKISRCSAPSVNRPSWWQPTVEK